MKSVRTIGRSYGSRAPACIAGPHQQCPARGSEPSPLAQSRTWREMNYLSTTKRPTKRVTCFPSSRADFVLEGYLAQPSLKTRVGKNCTLISLNLCQLSRATKLASVILREGTPFTSDLIRVLFHNSFIYHSLLNMALHLELEDVLLGVADGLENAAELTLLVVRGLGPRDSLHHA